MREEPGWADRAINQGADDPTVAALKREDPSYADWLKSPYTRQLRDRYYQVLREREDLDVQKRMWTYGFAHAVMLQHAMFTSADGALKIIDNILEALPVWAPDGTPGGDAAHAASHRIIPELNAIKGTLSRAVRLIFSPEGGPEEDEGGTGGGAPPAVAP